MKRICLSILMLVAVAFAPAGAAAAGPRSLLKVLIVDGQNNHDWRATTPILKRALETSGLFQVDVATTGPDDTSDFKPEFSRYQAVLSNYNGADWPQETQRALVEYVKNGGGLVIVHAADNSFPNWKEFNQMIGLGGWGGRNEKSGPYLRLRDGKLVRDDKPGPGGHHGAQHDFLITVRSTDHPITAGIPPPGCTPKTSFTVCCAGRPKTSMCWPPPMPIRRKVGAVSRSR